METLTAIRWIKACTTEDIPENEGMCAYINGEQIAIYNFKRRNEWFATQNLCPHKQQMVLSRGMIGSQENEPKVACPFHKKTFSLRSGTCMSGEPYQIRTYPVKVSNGEVFVGITAE